MLFFTTFILEPLQGVPRHKCILHPSALERGEREGVATPGMGCVFTAVALGRFGVFFFFTDLTGTREINPPPHGRIPQRERPPRCQDKNNQGKGVCGILQLDNLICRATA